MPLIQPNTAHVFQWVRWCLLRDLLDVVARSHSKLVAGSHAAGCLGLSQAVSGISCREEIHGEHSVALQRKSLKNTLATGMFSQDN